jgi:hypothetical protein
VFLGRRDKLIRAGWRHGITGVEDPSDPNPSVFYKNALEEKHRLQLEKDKINNRRTRSKFFHSI